VTRHHVTTTPRTFQSALEKPTVRKNLTVATSYCGSLLAESHLTQRLFGAMSCRIVALSSPAGLAKASGG
jgi:hypothetical protein